MTNAAETRRKDGTLESRNLTWGFYGTTQMNFDLDERETDRRYAHAFKMIKKATGAADLVVRRLLDSVAGRHIADAGVGRALALWPGWINKEISEICAAGDSWED